MKKLTILLVFITYISCAQDKKISELTEATTIGNDDLYVLVQSATTKKLKHSTLATYFTTANYTSTSTATYVGSGSGNTGNYNAFFGINVGGSNTGGYNEGMGYNTLYSNSGTYNSGIGYNAGYNSSGNYALIFGTTSGYNNSGDYVSLIGSNAGYNNSGSASNLIGYSAGYSNSASYCNAFGYNTLYSNNKSNILALGNYVLKTNTGTYNVGLGDSSLVNTTGNYNLALGYKNLNFASGALSGSYNIGIGTNNTVSAAARKYAAGIGHGLSFTQDSTFILDSAYNYVGISNYSPAYKLDVAGSTNTRDSFLLNTTASISLSASELRLQQSVAGTGNIFAYCDSFKTKEIMYVGDKLYVLASTELNSALNVTGISTFSDDVKINLKDLQIGNFGAATGHQIRTQILYGTGTPDADADTVEIFKYGTGNSRIDIPDDGVIIATCQTISTVTDQNGGSEVAGDVLVSEDVIIGQNINGTSALVVAVANNYSGGDYAGASIWWDVDDTNDAIRARMIYPALCVATTTITCQLSYQDLNY